jgi:hypothetical protein
MRTLGPITSSAQQGAPGLARVSQPPNVLAKLRRGRNPVLDTALGRRNPVLDTALGRRNPVLDTALDTSALDRMLNPSPPEPPLFLKRLTEASETWQRDLDAQHRTVTDMAASVAEHKARERQEFMGMLMRIVEASDEAQRRADVAENALARIAEAAEEMRADVAEAREAQRRAEARAEEAERREVAEREVQQARTLTAEKEARRWRWISLGVGVLTFAGGVALRLLGI